MFIQVRAWAVLWRVAGQPQLRSDRLMARRDLLSIMCIDWCRFESQSIAMSWLVRQCVAVACTTGRVAEQSAFVQQREHSCSQYYSRRHRKSKRTCFGQNSCGALCVVVVQSQTQEVETDIFWTEKLHASFAAIALGDGLVCGPSTAILIETMQTAT